ncbi:hypothetical protein I4641_17425 [Waterburya agarophytonicola K14]|uniref:Uncharacterized protein n=1 Tax=Waterburya agarophytonicola KI4 TaxID=2874699 RepID=A0A964FIW0_9CYAN|nr:hypothetical protein [Waterburya agarophytonicola]MCC0178754.1 hypothetical protein [Waterburya agarophytonicola KI4]
MVSNSQNDNEPNLLGKLVSLAIFLGAGLYFTGWTYRWAYYSFFTLEVTTLGLPIESFYIAAVQALFGSPLTICRTIVAAILTPIVIHFSLWFIEHFIFDFLKNICNKIQSRLNRYTYRRRGTWISQGINSFANFSSTEFNTIKFLRYLNREIIVVLWIGVVLFWLAQWQAEKDVWKDLVNETSTLPVVTLITPQDALRFGRSENNPLLNPSDVRIIGDRDRYTNLFGKELTDAQNSRVWRLLIDRDGYFYIFPALPSNSSRSSRPPVLMIYESARGDQLIILSPKTSEQVRNK